MTATAILATGTAGIFALLLVLTWYLVPLLQQARRTASAVEDLVVTTKPKLDESLDHLRSVLARADGLMTAVESHGGGIDLVGRLSKVMGGVSGIASAFSAATAGYSVIMSLWRMLTRPARSGEDAPITEEGGTA